MQRIFQQNTGLSVFYIVTVLVELQVRPSLFVTVGFAEHRNVKTINFGTMFSYTLLKKQQSKLEGNKKKELHGLSTCLRD